MSEPEENIVPGENEEDFDPPAPGANEEDDSIDLRVPSVDDLAPPVPANDLTDELGDRLTDLEETVDQLPQPPFFPGLAVFQGYATSSNYAELVPLNNTLSLAGTGSFVYNGTSGTGMPAITLSDNQFVGVLMIDGANIAVVKVSGGGSASGALSVCWLNLAGGSDGNGTTAASWTYDFFSDVAKTMSLGLAASPLFPRVTPAAGNNPATIGSYTTIAGVNYLVEVGESYTLEACTPTMGVAP